MKTLLDRAQRKKRDIVLVAGGGAGFSLLEMMIVVAIISIVTAVAVPTVLRAIQGIRLQESAIDYASLLQRARMSAVQDDRFYSVYVQPAAGTTPPISYIDMFPRNGTTSGHGNPANGGYYEPGPPADPMVTLSSEVTIQPAANAPNTAILNAAFCAACVAPGSSAVILSTGPNWAPTWGPNGLPCRPAPSVGGAGMVCNAAGGPVAYVTYLQSNANQSWEAVTVTPAGRVQIWRYAANTGTWSTH